MRRLPTRPPSPGWSPPITGPPRPSRPRPRLGVAVVAALLVLGAAGCGDDAAAPSSPTSTTTSSTTTTAAPDTAAATSTTPAPVGDEAEVRATIDRYWEAWFAATGNPPDPTNAELNAVLSGEALLRIVGGIEQWQRDGKYVQLPPETQFSREVVLVEFDSSGVATVRECVIDDTELVDATTGEVSGSGTSSTTFVKTLNRIEGTWRITTSIATGKVEGGSGCAPE